MNGGMEVWKSRVKRLGLEAGGQGKADGRKMLARGRFTRRDAGRQMMRGRVGFAEED